MKFRPLFWPTFFALPALAVLITLGSWQLQRLHWKTELIDQFKARSQAEAIYPHKDILEFQHVMLDGRFLHEKTIYMTGKTYEGNAGFHVVSAFETNKGDLFLVNRGWVSEAYKEPEDRAFSVKEEEVSLSGIVRVPQRQGSFVPNNEPERGFWFTLRPEEVARHLELATAETNYFIDVVRQPDEELTLPIAAEIKIDVRNAHLNYALTWYGIALSLIGVYFAYHHSLGRLSWGAAKDEENE